MTLNHNVVTVIDLVCRVINISDYGGNYSASLCPGEGSRKKSRLCSSCYASDVITLIRKQNNIQQAQNALKKGNKIKIDRSLVRINVFVEGWNRGFCLSVFKKEILRNDV